MSRGARKGRSGALNESTPQKNHGGKRPGAGRPSAAQKAIQKLEDEHGKDLDTILAEAEQGFAESINALAQAMPELTRAAIKRALKGDDIESRFLMTLFYKHMQPRAEREPESPITRLLEGLSAVVKESQANGVLRAPALEEAAEGSFRLVEDEAASGPGAANSGHDT